MKKDTVNCRVIEERRSLCLSYIQEVLFCNSVVIKNQVPPSSNLFRSCLIMKLNSKGKKKSKRK